MKKLFSFFILLSIFFVLLSSETKEKEKKKEKENLSVLKEEIVVSASLSDEVLKNLPGTIEIFSKEKIKKWKAPTLSELLEKGENFSIFSSGTYGQMSSIFFNGAASNHTLFLIDGVKIYDYSSMNFDPSLVNSLMFSKIEAVYGPQSSLYGDEAMGGVVNLITGIDKGLSFNFYGGSDKTLNSTISYGKEFKNFFTLLKSSYFKTDGEYENSDFKQKNALLKISKKTDSYSFSPFLFFGETNLGIPFNFGTKSPERRAKSWLLISALPFNFKVKNIRINLTLSFLKKEYELNDPEDFFQKYYYSEGQTFQSKAILKYNLDKENYPFVFGIDFLNSYISEKNNYGYVFKDKKVRYYSGFFEKTFSLKKLKFTFSLRGDKFNNFNFNLSKKAGLNFNLLEKNDLFISLYSVFSEGFRIPKPTELFSPWGNPYLQPEKSKNYESGFLILKNNFSVKLTYFLTDYKELIVFNPSTYRLTNSEKDRIKGLKFMVSGILRNYKYNFSYTKLSSKNLITEEKLPRRPNYIVKLGIGYKKGKMAFDVFGRFIGERKDYDEKTFSYIAAEPFSVFYSILALDLNDKASLFLKINNIFDKEYYEIFGYRAPKRKVVLGIDFKN